MSNRIRVNGNGGDHGLMHNAWYDALIDINVSESKAKAVAKLCAKGVFDNMEISKNFDLLNQKVDNLDVNLNQKIDNLGENLNQKIDNLDEKFTHKFEAVDKRFDAVDKRFDKLEADIDKSISDLKIESRWLFGIFFAVLSGIGAVLIEVLSKLN